MNWKQLYASSTPAERLEMIGLMLRAVEQRQNKKIFSHGWLIRERRRAVIAHFVGERRRAVSWPRLVRLATFAFILATVTASVILVAYNVDLIIGIPIVLMYEIALVALMYSKPKRAGWSAA